MPLHCNLASPEEHRHRKGLLLLPKLYLMLQELLKSNDLNVRVTSSMCQGWVNNVYNIHRRGDDLQHFHKSGVSYTRKTKPAGGKSLHVVQKYVYHMCLCCMCSHALLQLRMSLHHQSYFSECRETGASMALVITSSADRKWGCRAPHTQTRRPPYNVGVMTEENTAPSFPALLWAIFMCCPDSWWETKL